MRRLICCVTLLSFIFACSYAALEMRPALPFASSAMAASAAAPEDIVPLPFDTLLTGTIPPRSPDACGLGQTEYAIQYPGGATQIKIEISTPSRLDLSIFARFGQRAITDDGRIVADFSARGGAPLTFPVTGPHLFEAGTYFIAVGNCSPEMATYTIRASLLVPPDADTVELPLIQFPAVTTFGEIPAATPGSCSLGRTQYKVTTPPAGPCGVVVLVGFGAQSNQSINIYIRRDQRVAVEDGRIIADMTTTAPRNSQFISVPSGGTFFIAIGNCSLGTADYVISLNQVIADPVLDIPLVNGCHLLRNPTGSFVLEVFGSNIKEGATVTVGGVSPKKVKFVELEPGTTNHYRIIRLVKRFCGNLPGNIVVSNPPGPCGSISTAFFCNQVCAN
ncbi:MAG TPA: hypothetical protein VJ464_26745 [Blastocatellia bacterium]|nr:hypothetical protein [Blastocatellia bacterium]